MPETNKTYNHPQISSLYDLYLSETQPFRKVHRMIDLFETIIKMHTVVIMGEYFKRNELSEMAKGMLAYGLQTPSLGTWQKFSRDLCSELISNKHPFVLNYFKDEFLLFDKSNNDKTNIISFRNRYAHGATPNDKDCEADIIQFEPFLLKLLASKWLYESQLIIIDNLVFIQSKTSLEKLNLHPILVCKEETNGQPFTFFNDIKDEKVGLLNYPLSKHYREQKTYIEEFYAVLPLKEWKQNVSNEFKQYIEELTEGFKGRIMELKAISTFITTKEKGYLSIQGNPGIGKSALIAKVIRELNKSEYNKRYKLCEYFIRRGTRSDNNINLLNHLLKTTDIYYPEGKSIMPEGTSNWDLQKALFAKWNAFGCGSPKFKIIFLIDGLDEGVENDILNYLPRENFKNILFIYGSRHGGHLKLASFWTELPIENHETILLGGLNKEDIRAFLYEVVNKYEIDQIWIDEILNRSEGNPLYLKLLCNALENGSIAMNNSKALPKEIDSYYKAILDRYAQQTDGDILFECLLLFAVAEDYLTPAHLGIMNSMSIASQQRVMSILTEVLYENPQTDFVLDYQLFHESFREYLIKTYPLEIKKANQKIINSCQKWQELETLFEQRYVLEYYATHLIKSATVENKEVLVELSKNAAFQKTQNQVLRNYNANYSLLRAALLAASELNQKEDVIEIGLCLVDLQYEEKNDVQSIIDMVANNEMELALQRIESFGGNDKEGLQQKFILYMLCFMELTLLESKNKPFRKEAIEKLLKHFDDNIPVDHSVLNWNDFFPSYLVFLISVEIKKLDLDYSELYKRIYNWDSDWIKDHGTYTEVQIEVMLGATKSITKSTKKIKVLSEISIVLYTQKHFELSEKVIQKAIVCVNDIIDKIDKCISLIIISDSFISQGNKEMAWLITQQAIDISEEISDIDEKSTALVNISVGIATQGKIALALETAHEISDELAEKSNALKDISINVAAQGSIIKALEITTEINDEDLKNRALNEIAVKAVKNGNFKQALEIAELINDLEIKVNVFCKISTNQFKQNNILLSEQIMQQALLLVKEIKVDWQKVYALRDISVGFLKQNKLKESFQIINEALEITKLINHVSFKKMLLSFISMDLVKMGNIEMGIDVANGILRERENIDAINNICIELTTQGNIEKVFDIFKLNYNEQSMRLILKDITNILLKQGNIKRANQIIQLSINSSTINKFVEKYEITKEIYFKLINENKIEQAISIVEGLEDQFVKCELLVLGCSDLINQSNKNKAELLLNKALLNIKNIDEDKLKCEGLIAISSAYLNFENFALSNEILQQAIEVANGISDDDSRDYSIIDISKEFSKRGSFVEAISFSKEIKSELKKSLLLKNVAIEFSKHKRFEEAIEFTKNINVEWIKSDAQSTIAIEISKQDLLNNILDIIPQITEEEVKQDTLYKISVVLSKNGDLDKALEIIEKIESIKHKVYALVSISNQFFIISNIVKAEQTLNAAILLINNIDDVRTLSFIYMWISKTYLKQGNEILAFETVLKITQINDRIKFWKKLGSENYLEKSITFCTTQLKTLPNKEALFFYKRGMTEAITATNANASNVLELLELVKEDTKSIAHLLQMHALYLCFFEKTNSIKIQRFNKSLNLQWAIDIAAKFEKEFERASNNLQEWINEIEDENDREDVLGWAEKVEQGKMTEEKFLERINKL